MSNNCRTFIKYIYLRSKFRLPLYWINWYNWFGLRIQYVIVLICFYLFQNCGSHLSELVSKSENQVTIATCSRFVERFTLTFCLNLELRPWFVDSLLDIAFWDKIHDVKSSHYVFLLKRKSFSDLHDWWSFIIF